ncbi:MAG: helix-turn-helix domain-containing protein [Streptosporangiales bacterium]
MTEGAEPDTKEFGRAVARLRKLRGMSQREFAAVVDRSETWLSQVERGVRRIDRMTVLQRLANALGVAVSELAPDTPVAVAQEPAPEAASLTLALASPTAVTAAFEDRPPADAEALSQGVEEAWRQVDAADYAAAGKRLTELVPELEHAARAEPGQERHARFVDLSRAYQAYALVLAELGEFTGSWIAAERAITAAERSGDELLMAASELRLVAAFRVARQDEYVLRAAAGAVEALSDRVASGEPAAVTLAGALRLQMAVAAARRDDADTAYDQVERAATLAAGGTDRNDYGAAFGPTHVAVYRVAVAVELGDAGSALRTAAGADASSLPMDAQARHLINVARAHAQRRNLAGVVEALRRAHELAPRQVVGHPLVLQLVTDLLHSGHDDGLRELARELQVPGHQ